MSRTEAIRNLRDALTVLRKATTVPLSEPLPGDPLSGEVTKISYPYAVGFTQGAIEAALEELGAEEKP